MLKISLTRVCAFWRLRCVCVCSRKNEGVLPVHTLRQYTITQCRRRGGFPFDPLAALWDPSERARTQNPTCAIVSNRKTPTPNPFTSPKVPVPEVLKHYLDPTLRRHRDPQGDSRRTPSCTTCRTWAWPRRLCTRIQLRCDARPAARLSPAATGKAPAAGADAHRPMPVTAASGCGCERICLCYFQDIDCLAPKRERWGALVGDGAWGQQQGRKQA